MPKTGRNDLCPCGSGRKYKKCCESASGGATRGRVMLLVVCGAVAAALLVGIASFSGERSSGATRVWSADHGHYHDASGTAVP